MTNLAITPAHPAAEGTLPRVRAYKDLMKLRLNSLVGVAVGVGYLAGTAASPMSVAFLGLIIGSYLAACGTSALNMAMESDRDRLMVRTMRRPIPAGLITPFEASVFGSLLAVSGLGIMLVTTNALATALTALTVILYVFLYTPLKTRTTMNTLVGAIPGALPALIGQAAATGTVTLQAWSLFAIIFLWQFPHFLAIAVIYSEDYRKGGFRMLPVVDRDGKKTGLRAMQAAALLVPASVSPVLCGICAPLPFIPIALLLSFGFLAATIRASRQGTIDSWRVVLRASFIHLTVLFIAITVEQLLR